jgi:quinol monooxygenase YgiN
MIIRQELLPAGNSPWLSDFSWLHPCLSIEKYHEFRRQKFMVITILEASVDPQYWQKLESVFSNEVKTLDPGIVQTYLVHNKREENLWRIITIWESQAALDVMRLSGETPRGVVMFHLVDAQPQLTIYDVIAQSVQQLS